MKQPIFGEEQAVIFKGEVYKVLIYLKNEKAYLLRGYACKVKENDLKAYNDETTKGKASAHPEGMEP